MLHGRSPMDSMNSTNGFENIRDNFKSLRLRMTSQSSSGTTENVSVPLLAPIFTETLLAMHGLGVP